MGDIRYISWAGYDLAGTSRIISIDGPPELESSVQGSLTMSPVAIAPSTKAVSSSSIPSTRSSYIDNKPSISRASELRPFPKPRS